MSHVNSTDQFIDGAWVPSAGGESISVVDASTARPIGQVAAGNAQDVDRAVEAARAAQRDWQATTVSHRAHLLRRLAEELSRRGDDIALTIAREVGTPLRTATRVQAALPVTDLTNHADLLEQADDAPERIGNSLVYREPVGVVGAITPWNYPLHQITAKVAPALATGCAIVIKPSEVAPLSAMILADAVSAAGFPDGLVNIVNGTGADVGEPLVTHPGIDAVSFTGSERIGIHIAQLAARSLKRVTLELGGKSANVVLDDANLGKAVKVGVANAYLNNGQTCTAWTRLLVPESRYDEAVDLAVAAAKTYVASDPTQESTRLGPLASPAQLDRVRDFIDQGVAEGSTLLTGGKDAPSDSAGFFVEATVFGDVDPDSTLAQEEIFGPVLSILSFRDDENALEIANNSRFGLHGAVWSADQDRALAFARRVQAGQIDVNGAAFNSLAPFGGYRHSGLGREMGRYGLDEFVQLKAVQV